MITNTQRQLFLLLLCAVAVDNLQSGDYRSPSLNERGPLRYLFAEDKPKENHTVDLWSGFSSRQADRAFTDELGTKTDHLSRLIFNKSDFRVTEIFPNLLIKQTEEFYNPLLRTARLSPRVDYNERTFTFGARWTNSVNDGQGRVGIRAVVPIKRIDIKNVDQDFVAHGADLEDVVSVQLPGAVGTTLASTNPAIMVRMDFAESLIQSSSRNQALNYGKLSTAIQPKIGASQISFASSTSVTDIQKDVAIVRSPEGHIPRLPDVSAVVVETTGDGSSPTVASGITLIPLAGNGIVDFGHTYFFSTTTDYSGLDDNPDVTTQGAILDPVARLALQEIKEQLWLIPFKSNTATVEGTQAGSSMKILNDLAGQVTQNTLAWIQERGTQFATDWKAGFGDIDVDLFYEHDLTDKMHAEVMAGVRIPSGGGQHYANNPYKVRLGNGGHWEIRTGGAYRYKPAGLLNVHAEAYYSWVLNGRETRPATFKGANIKNLGPAINADVDWSYFVGRINLSTFHSRGRALSNVIGYEFYWRGREHVQFDQVRMASWIGRDSLNGLFDTTIPNNILVNQQELDANVSTLNTDAIAHKIRFETSFRMTTQCEIYLNSSYVFAGKNVPQELEARGGCNVIF